eukprot:6176655-Pleurochrysis_carterae.AAC.3
MNGRLTAHSEVSVKICQLIFPDVKHHIAKLERRIHLHEQIGRADDAASTSMTAGPRHCIKLKLKLALRKKRIGWVKLKEIAKRCGSAYHGAGHGSDAPRCRIEVELADTQHSKCRDKIV